MEWIVAEKARKSAIVARLWVHASAGYKRVTKIYRFCAAVIWFFTLHVKCVGKQLKLHSSWFIYSPRGITFPASDAFYPLILIYHVINSSKKVLRLSELKGPSTPKALRNPNSTLSDHYKFVYLVNQMFNTQGKCGCGIDTLVPVIVSVFTNAAQALHLHLCPNCTIWNASRDSLVPVIIFFFSL